VHPGARCAHIWLVQFRTKSGQTQRHTLRDASVVPFAKARKRAQGLPTRAKFKEVDFIDGAQHFGDRTLDDLVLQGRDAEWTAPAIGFRDVDTPYRLWPVAPGVDARTEIPEICLQALLVVRHRDPIDSRACLPLLTRNDRSSASASM
jgi:hypothetical protein